MSITFIIDSFKEFSDYDCHFIQCVTSVIDTFIVKDVIILYLAQPRYQRPH